jgi:hypothetical protein
MLSSFAPPFHAQKGPKKGKNPLSQHLVHYIAHQRFTHLFEKWCFLGESRQEMGVAKLSWP